MDKFKNTGMTWEEYLEFYYNKYKFNFTVQKIAKFPYPWLHYRTPEYYEFIKDEKYVSQREIFHDEVVFDIDMDKDLATPVARAEAERIAAILSERMKKLDFSHSVWSSGGSGVHIHLFFPELFTLNSVDVRIMKKVILKQVGYGFIKMKEGSGKVQTQTCVTIQLENAKHRKGGTKKLLYEYHDLLGEPNKIPLDYFVEMEREKNNNHILKRYFKEYTIDNKPEAIAFLENERFYNVKDGRVRALFVLTAYYKQFLTDEEVANKMREWNKKILKGYLSEKQIKATVKGAKPLLVYNYLVELFDDLGLSQKYVEKLKKK